MRFISQDVPSLCLELGRAFDSLNNPQEPKPLFHCTTATRPAAASFPWCSLFNETTGTVQTSNGTSWV